MLRKVSMKTKTSYGLLRFVLIILVTACMAPLGLPKALTAADGKEQLLNDLYRKSGLEKQVAQAPDLLKSGFVQASKTDPHLKGLPKDKMERIVLSIPTVFSGESIKEAIMDEIRTSMSADAMKKAISWLDSPLGRKFTQWEEASTTVEAYAEQQAFIANLDIGQVPAQRRALLQKLDEAMNASEANVDMAMSMQLAITVAIVATLPTERQPTRKQLESIMEKTRPQIESMIKAQSLGSFLFTYRQSTDDELESLIAFASSPEGKTFQKATMSGFRKALVNGSFTWGGVIADILGQKPVKTDV